MFTTGASRLNVKNCLEFPRNTVMSLYREIQGVGSKNRLNLEHIFIFDFAVLNI